MEFIFVAKGICIKIRVIRSCNVQTLFGELYKFNKGSNVKHGHLWESALRLPFNGG